MSRENLQACIHKVHVIGNLNVFPFLSSFFFFVFSFASLPSFFLQQSARELVLRGSSRDLFVGKRAKFEADAHFQLIEVREIISKALYLCLETR